MRCHHKLTGSGTTIAIIDGGIASSHSSLAGRTLIDGHNFVPGFTEKDWHGPTGMDNHGTAVAAVVGGREFISASTVVPHGIAPEAGLYICRVFHNNKHYNVPNALQHIVNLQNETKSIDILCMSFKLPGKNEGIESLLAQLASLGVVCVAAAGNDGDYQKGITFPASDPNVLSVGALRPRGKVSDLNPRDNIDVYAPGEDLCLPSLESANGVTLDDGTSYSTPMVAGFISLLIQCANAYNPHSSNIIKKFHDVKFLKELFNNKKLCDRRRLLHVSEFLTRLFVTREYRLLSLITDVYPEFLP